MFTPSELAEEADLPLEAKKEILYLHAHLGTFDHWRLLGVAWNATPEAVREAYRERVKVFHPDRWAGRRLGSYLARIERVFRALTLARDALCDETSRAAYLRKTAPPEEFARLEARRLEDEVRAQERRARMARGNPLVARAARIHDLMQRGRQAMADGRFTQAANDFLTAVALDPRVPEARALAEEARRRGAGEKARDLYERAGAAEAVGNAAAALAMLRDAIAADPGNVRAGIAAARLAVQAGSLDDARGFAEQAVRAGPREALAHEVLGVVLHAQGEKAQARRAVERALELDPGLESARALSRKLRWSILG